MTHGSKPGASTALTPVGEDTLVLFLIYMANSGFPLTCTMVKPLHGQYQRGMKRMIGLIQNMDRNKNGGVCSCNSTPNLPVEGLTHLREVKQKPRALL